MKPIIYRTSGVIEGSTWEDFHCKGRPAALVVLLGFEDALGHEASHWIPAGKDFVISVAKCHNGNCRDVIVISFDYVTIRRALAEINKCDPSRIIIWEQGVCIAV